jgi:hypothetical protein
MATAFLTPIYLSRRYHESLICIGNTRPVQCGMRDEISSNRAGRTPLPTAFFAFNPCSMFVEKVLD